MTDKLKPALTAEEWRRLNKSSIERLAWGNPGRTDPDFCGTPDPFRFADGGGEYSDSLYVRPERRHTLAALALHGQPFGFTREDVEALRNLVADLHPNSEPFHSLAARIEALLPPEDTK